MPNINLFHESCSAMNTCFDVVCYGIEDIIFKQAFEEFKTELQRTENIISCYSKTSELYNLNKTAKHSPVNVSIELFEILSLCKEYYNKTNGCFDITLKPLIDYLKKEPERNKNKLNSILSNTGVNKIIFDSNDKTIAFANEHLQIDLGGIGKGYALQKIEAIISRYKIENIFISFGNSSVLTKGKHPYGDYWPFGICDIHKPEKILHTFPMNDHAISTSATIQNIQNAQKPSYHIINPKTGMHITNPKLISVKSSSPIIAEMLSTALLVANIDSEKEIISNFDEDEIIEVSYDKNLSARILKIL